MTLQQSYQTINERLLKKYIYWIIVSLIVFGGLVFEILNILNNKENRLYKKITEFHLISEKTGLHIRKEIDDVKLWSINFLSMNRNDSELSRVHPITMEKRIVVRDKLNGLIFIIGRNLKILKRLQDEYDQQQFEFLLSRMEEEFEGIKSQLEMLQNEEISVNHIDQLINPISSTTHQFEKLHDIAYRIELEKLEQIKDYHSKIRKFMLIIGVLIGIIFITFMLRQIKLVITNRDQIKTQLKGSEVKFRDFIQGADDLIIQIDNEGKILFVNTVSEKIFGWKSEECIGKLIFEYIHPDDRERTESILLGNSEDKIDGKSLENRLIHKDGNNSDMLWTINYHYDEKGDLLFTNSIAHDITERKIIESSFIASEKRFESFMDHFPGSAYIKDESGKYVYTNSGFHKVVKETLGIDNADWIGKYDSDFLPKKSADQLRINDKEVLNSGQLKKTVEMISGNNGIKYWISYKFPIILDEGKEKLLASMSIDITEQKTAVDDLSVSEFNLKKAQEMAHIGSWDLDLLTNRLNWSDEVYRIFGLAPQEFGATYEAFIEAIHPDDRDMVNKAYLNSVENNVPYEVVHRVLRPNGEVRIVREKSEEVFDRNGKAIRSVGTVHDITELEETTRRLEKERNHFDKLLESIGEVVFIMNYRERVIERVNSEIKSVFGYESFECIGKSTRILCQNEEDFIEFGKTLQEAIKRGDEVVHLKQTFVKKNGETFPSEITLSFLRDEGEITHVISIVRDVSESERAERALRESEARNLKAQEKAHLGYWDWNIITNEVIVSDEFLRISNQSREQIDTPYTIEKFIESIHPEDRDSAHKAVDMALENIEEYDIDFRLLTPDNTVKWANSAGGM